MGDYVGGTVTTALAWMNSPPSSRTPTTTIAPLWFRPWRTAWRTLPSACTNRCARSSGATQRRAMDDLIKERYRGIRPAGYPACRTTRKKPPVQAAGCHRQHQPRADGTFRHVPDRAVSGWYFAHPESKYFAVGKIGVNQVEDYAERKGCQSGSRTLADASLAYDPKNNQGDKP